MTIESESRLDAGDLQLKFAAQGDRVGHEISMTRLGQQEIVLCSIEGDPSQDWPPSPPLQSVHVERWGDGPARALLVGMAGRSHWSASVESGPGDSQLRFDIAARVREAPTGHLGVTYQTAWQAQVRDARQVMLLVPAGSGAGLLIQADERFGDVCIDVNKDRLTIHPTDRNSSSANHTIRWAYTITAERNPAALA